MVLVDYGSSDSEQEPHSAATPPKEKAIKPNKPLFEKLVDKAKPGTIRVNLVEEAAKTDQQGASDGLEPAAKRAKTSTFGGFNSFLPAPKRAGGPTGGLAKGVNLKTGAAPGFTREAVAQAPDDDHDQEGSHQLDMDEDKVAQTARLEENSGALSDGSTEQPTGEQPKKKSTMFKPLSVARKPAKKKVTPAGNASTTSQAATANAASTDPSPKVSLFSIGDVSKNPRPSINPTNCYEPLVYTTQQPSHEPNPNIHSAWDQRESQEATGPHPTIPSHQTSNEPQSLDSIATDLNLSASARRQLLGRNQQQRNVNNINTTKITTFNTDEEYAANEILRQSGEIVQHNAVRGVAPGKHSLKQLVNAATTQKDALEEQFAAGRRNKSEAGARYGW